MLNREAAHPKGERISRTGFMAQKEIESFTSDHYDLHGRKSLGGKLFGDLFAAAVTATLVAPSVTLIDRQVDAKPSLVIDLLTSLTRVVVEKASSNKPLLRGLRCHSLAALERPGKLFLARPFTSVWTLYAATYAVANSAETVTKDFGLAAAGTITFAATLAVNIPLGVKKDLRFAQCYGSAAELAAKQALKPRPAASVPKAAAATFLVRDALTIFGSFVLPPRVADAIPDELAGPHAKVTFTQMTVPVVSQLVATPVHLLGLSLYDRAANVPVRERLAAVWRVMPAATAVRCVRIIPAFGLGVLANKELRWFCHGKVDGV
ncbi:hypothetical protein UCDDS831_g06341 [Diplodia seriata]|uniref:Sequence orphan n=1 Tax=Diplodia seriata TaxID=420778 RepID=A0A0G2G101_9PEZI|nr:hypothetical protein UCDDS831_g06341 [Diplodia seriata]